MPNPNHINIIDNNMNPNHNSVDPSMNNRHSAKRMGIRGGFHLGVVDGERKK
jgi:hypothetical protein